MNKIREILIPVTRPLAYLTIRHSGSGLPLWINWTIPAFITGCLLFIGFFASIDIWSPNGVASRILSFVQSLPGFYIAALAAIATFGDSSMQQLMPGTPPTMSVYRHGIFERNIQLTRRIFLSSMFSYLTALSIILTILGIGGLAVSPFISASLDSYLFLAAKTLASGVYLLLTCQLICITFWGLYYLGERIHLT